MQRVAENTALVSRKGEDEIQHAQRGIACEHDDGQRKPEMRLPHRSRKHRRHQEQRGGFETFVDDRVQRQRRMLAGTHVVVRHADQHADAEEQQQLPHAHAEREQRDRQAEGQPQSALQIARQID